MNNLNFTLLTKRRCVDESFYDKDRTRLYNTKT